LDYPSSYCSLPLLWLDRDCIVNISVFSFNVKLRLGCFVSLVVCCGGGQLF
jgi:hypothetical protein